MKRKLPELIRNKRILLSFLVLSIGVGIWYSSFRDPMIGTVTERTRTSTQTYIGRDSNGNQKFKVDIAGTPLHYQNKDGQWIEYDTSLIKTDKKDYSYELASAEHQAYFKDKPENNAIAITSGDKTLTLSPGLLQYVNDRGETQVVAKPNMKAKSTVKDNTITYKDIYGPGLDLKFTTTSNHVAKELIIRDKKSLISPSIPNAYLELTMNFATPKNVDVLLKPFSNPLGSPTTWNGETIMVADYVNFKETGEVSTDRNYDGVINDKDATLYSFVPAVARDSSENGNEISSLVSTEDESQAMKLILFQQKNINTASIRTSYSWLDKAQYPVYIDPTVTFDVGLSADDGQWDSASAFSATGTSLQFGTNGTATLRHSFMRFTNVSVPSGATVTNATIYGQAPAVSSGTPLARIQAVAEDNPTTITSAANANGRTLTTALLEQHSIPVFAIGTNWTSDSFAPVVQEVIDRNGWSVNNAMMIVIREPVDSGTNNFRYISAFDHATRPAPQLSITYTLPLESKVHWKFNEGQGTTANDSSLKRNDGTISGATWQQEDACVKGKCLSFDGSGDLVSRSDDKDLDFDDGVDFTISAWVNSSNIGTVQTVLAKKTGNSIGGAGYLINIGAGGSLNFYASDGTDQYWRGTDTTLSNNKWYHVVFVYDEDTLGNSKFYINGVIDSGGTTGTIGDVNNVSSSQSFVVGMESDSQVPFYGKIDDVIVYNYALTNAQILSEYNSGASLLGAKDQKSLSHGLVGYWKMDEASWTNDCSTTSVTDSSGNGFNGRACPSSTGPTGGVVGKFGNAGFFDDSNDYVSVADSALLDMTGDMTVSVWVFTPASFDSVDTVIAKKNGTGAGSTGYMMYFDSTGKPNFAVSDGTDSYEIQYDSALSASTWYHLTAVLDKDSIENTKFYVNGSSTSSTVTGGTLANVGDISNSTILALGAEADAGNPWGGKIDETKIYNRAFAPNEVIQLYSYSAGPVAYWDLEEGSGSTVIDKSGNGLNGTFLASGKRAEGKYGGGMRRTSVASESIEISDNSLIKPTGAISVELWYKPIADGSTLNNDHILEKGSNYGIMVTGTGQTGCANHSLCFRISTGALGAYEGASYAKSNLLANQWYHITGTFDGSSIKLYLNGTLVGTATSTNSTMTTDSLVLCLGDNENTDCSNTARSGYYDEFKIYNYARTATQVIEDMNGGHPVGGSPNGSQVGYWKFNEGNGAIANNSGNQSNILKGTITGASWTSSGKFGSALNFDGVDDYVDLTSDTSLDDMTQKTISAWIYPETVGEGSNGQIIWKNAFTLRTTTNNQLQFNQGFNTTSGVWNTGNNAITLNAWNHVAVTYDRSSASNDPIIYVNGRRQTLTETTPSGTANTDAASNLYAGNNGTTGTQSFDGLIDEIKIYSTLLSDAQISLDYNAGKSLQLGVLGTDASGNPSNATDRAYCPPGDTTATCGPVMHLGLEEKNGSTTNDKTGTGNNGTISGATWINGKIGGALSFDGDDYVEVDDSNSLDITNQISFSAWIYPTNLNGVSQHIISKSGPYEFRTHTDSTVRVRIGALSDNFSGSTMALSNNNWYHVVGTYDGSRYAVYINGVLQSGSTDATSGTIGTGSTDVYIGAITSASSTNNFYGRIDEPKIYNYALSPSQVAWDYSRGKAVAHYKFDECSGSTGYDASGNGNNATLDIGAAGTTTVGDCTTSATSMRYNGRIGKRNYGLAFDGTDDYVNIPDSSVLEPDVISISAWIYPSNVTGTKNIVSKYGDVSFDDSYKLGLSGNNAIFNVNLTGTGWANLTGTTSLSANTWNYITGVYDGTNLRIYVNGKLDNSSTTTGPIYKSDASTKIGKPGTLVSGEMFNGLIDDVRIYNYPMSQQQIRAEMNQGAVRWGPDTGAP